MRDSVKKWVEALRSGEYKQAKGRLNDGTGHCCLGVACEVYLKEHPGGLRLSHSGEWTYYDGNGYGLPITVQRWLGVHSDSVDLGGTDTLATLNDHGTPFEEIARVIESRTDLFE